MASSIQSLPEFEVRLSRVRMEIQKVIAKHPNERVLRSIDIQLSTLYLWTRKGQPLPKSLKDSLNFDQLAIRYVHDIDSALAANLCEIACFIL